ncbi:MAG TPA: molecular chaperone TorD family protein [Syntrophales bacterium]|nr:molecular chaperone TorD family protein [Syntrophales bacterium]
MESVEKKSVVPSSIDPYASIRTDVYVILAALLVAPPSEDHLNVLRKMEWDEDIPEKMHKALGALRRASCDYQLAVVQEEYNRLFVGLGCGEVIPYASWYRERAIQSLPLASLRSDLLRLGIVRKEDNHDSEDNAGALCEIMALISQEANNGSYETQAAFFDRHVASWMMAFFKDVESAKSARFYRVVGSLGCCFLESEKEYLKYGSNDRVHAERRRI